MKIGLWWSNQGTSLVYAVFNDTLIDENVIKVYKSFEGSKLEFNESQNIIRQRYPKVKITFFFSFFVLLLLF